MGFESIWAQDPFAVNTVVVSRVSRILWIRLLFCSLSTWLVMWSSLTDELSVSSFVKCMDRVLMDSSYRVER